MKVMDTQWLPVYISLITPVATLAIVMVGFLYNNGRVSDLRQDVLNRMGELSKRVDDRIDDLKDLTRAEMRRLEAESAKIHSEMLHRFGDLDTRLTRIESRLNMK